MNIKLYVLAIAVTFSLKSFSQQQNQNVIAPAGEISSGKSVVLEWTLGETTVERGQSFFSLLTQGFHQSFKEIATSNDKPQGPNLSIELEVSPNPTSSFLNIKFNKSSGLPLSLLVTDLNGKLVLTKNVSSKTQFTTIDVTQFSAGVYFLRIINKLGALQGRSTFIKFL